MAIKTNTTKNVNKSSEALANKCEATQKNMAKLVERAGCKDAKMIKTVLPNLPGSSDDVQYVGLNGVDFYFKRGESVNMPEPVAEILKNCGWM